MTLIMVNLPEACWPPRCTCTIAQLSQATLTGATRINVPTYHSRLEPEPSAASSSSTTTQSMHCGQDCFKEHISRTDLDRKVLKVQLACMHLKKCCVIFTQMCDYCHSYHSNCHNIFCEDHMIS